MRTIDLFAGVGGIRIGFEKAGFNTVFANDFEPSCKETYDLNVNETPLLVEDINKLDIEKLPEFDMLLGGFPCQAFSIAGYRKGFKDQGRGDLFFKIAEIIEIRKPKVVFLENVKNLKTHDNGNTFKIIKKTLNELDYTVKSKILNTKDYGNIPQNRERIFIVAFLDKDVAEKFKFPEKSKLTKKIQDFLEPNVNEKYYYNGKALYVNLKNEVTDKNSVYQWRRRYVRQNKSGVVPTLTANMGTGGHNVPIIIDDKGIRKLTPKECFMFQGFPKSFKLPDLADSKLYKQAGNSVSVTVIERVAKNIKKALEK
ncbi:MAG: DNA cytosine methyltransferase [Nanoarchaeota archaeon]|nr:DNA cytosine methyltransferase [Nanoarchaeota archaeon]MBU1322142.1 DNA cytosine methyltransferase [Nanoarchaeota archaeon]MBU1597863.1 DNA cytosine methyltransferase [Nanoarchaeota archaeon]MBU2441791.1 DNA cytosine methyltransferase [Nanoarchaeota archaeon]